MRTPELLAALIDNIEERLPTTITGYQGGGGRQIMVRQRAFEHLEDLCKYGRAVLENPRDFDTERYVATVNRLTEICDPLDMNVLKTTDMFQDLIGIEGIHFPNNMRELHPFDKLPKPQRPSA